MEGTGLWAGAGAVLVFKIPGELGSAAFGGYGGAAPAAKEKVRVGRVGVSMVPGLAK